MYICLCKAVTDGQIRKAISDGAQSLRDVRDELGIMTCCGKCACDARDIVRSTIESNQSSESLYHRA